MPSYRSDTAGDSILHERWRAAVGRAMDVLERHESLSAAPDLGDITIAVTLSYVDFRMSDVDWRAKAPRLAEWHERISARRSMTSTVPE